jgi:thioredoxin-related protein
MIAPTQRYGYVARGQEAGPEEELAYIESIRKSAYSDLGALPTPVSEENFKNYGASTTPTLVLLDRAGKVALYHPGFIGYDDLASRVSELAQSKKPAATN